MSLEVVNVGTSRSFGDECRRYRPIQIGFDTRNAILEQTIEPTWDREIQEQWNRNQAAVRMELLAEHGTFSGEEKIANYKCLGPAPWSIVYEHSIDLVQVRSAFTHGDYFPALVSACALGERIFNHLLLTLRPDYINHRSTTKRVRSQDTFTDWGVAIDVLHGWTVLDESTRDSFLALEQLRHASVHYDPSVNAIAKEPALQAIQLVQSIVVALFTAAGGPPLYIPGTPGASFFSRAAEDVPLVKRVSLPRSALVSPHHGLRPGQTPAGELSFEVIDEADYDPSPLSDSEFAAALTYA